MKIAFVNKPAYAEESQPNPIRWAILSGTPEEGFKNETSWMKCKDFFNDVVYTINTQRPVAIYGFDTSKMVLPKKGEPLYVAVKDVTEWFPHNVMKCTDVPIYTFAGTQVLVIDPKYLANTYNISLLTLIIRLCNVNQEFKNFEELCEHKQFPQKDQAKWDVVVAKGVFFNLPEGLSKYVWYCDAGYNSEAQLDDYCIPSLVHNGGVLTYTRAM